MTKSIRNLIKFSPAFLSFEGETEKKSFQFLPPRTYGSLDTRELPELETNEKLKEIIIKTADTHSPLMQAIQQAGDKMGIKLTVLDMKATGEGDFFGSGQGMNTDFPEIELFLSMVSPYAFIPASDEEKKEISDAFHGADDKKRALLIKKIGKDLLTTGTIIPLTVRSYLHVFNKDKIDASGLTTYDGDIPFWKIRML